MEILDAGDRRDDAEQAVVLAGVAHAVLMRACHHDRRIRGSGFVASDNVAKRIEIRGHPRISHEVDQVPAGLLVLLAQVGARDARRILGKLREHIGLAEKFGSKSHGGTVEGFYAELYRAVGSSVTRMALKSLTLVSVGPVTTESPNASKKL